MSLWDDDPEPSVIPLQLPTMQGLGSTLSLEQQIRQVRGEAEAEDAGLRLLFGLLAGVAVGWALFGGGKLRLPRFA